MKKSTEQLLEEYMSGGNKAKNPQKLIFVGVEGYDVYNITAPFYDNGFEMIAGRVEKRDSEDSDIRFFKKENQKWVLIPEPSFRLQDPSVTKIGNELVLVGVEISTDPENESKLVWRTAFYKGANLRSLKFFLKGPIGMKDIRLVELPDNNIGIFTRPQGEKFGRGKIGFTTVGKLMEMNEAVLNEAPLIDDLFLDEEWGGANDIHPLDGDRLGVLGHIARFSDGDVRHYYPMTFIFDYKTFTASSLKIIAQRADFVPGESKRDDLTDVVFSGGFHFGEKDLLYVGTGDCEAQCIEIDRPFA